MAVYGYFLPEFLNNHTTTKCSNKLTTKEPPATNHKLSNAQADHPIIYPFNTLISLQNRKTLN